LGRVCTICSHEQRFPIEELLATRQSTYRGIARKHGVSEDAVSRHVKAGHVSQLLALAADAERAAQADNLLDRIEALHRRTLAILEAVEGTDEHGTALAAIREARRNLELVGEVSRELDRTATVHLALNPEWLELRGVIITALEPHPSARDSVLRALEGVGNNGRP
jgi:transposase-like protein